MKHVLFACSLVLTLVLTPQTLLSVDYDNQDITLSYPGMASPESWDLTAGDVVLSFTIDLSDVTNTVPESYIQPYVRVGMAEQGLVNGFWITAGHAGWMLINTPNLPPDNINLNADEALNLQRTEWVPPLQDYDATDLNTVITPFGTTSYDISKAYAIFFDRYQYQYQNNGARFIPGATIETEGLYRVKIVYHAISPTQGTMFASINGEPQGIYGDNDYFNLPLDQNDFWPAGVSFSGDMTRMVVFAGGYFSGRDMGTIHVTDLSAVRTSDIPVADIWLSQEDPNALSETTFDLGQTLPLILRSATTCPYTAEVRLTGPIQLATPITIADAAGAAARYQVLSATRLRLVVPNSCQIDAHFSIPLEATAEGDATIELGLWDPSGTVWNSLSTTSIHAIERSFTVSLFSAQSGNPTGGGKDSCMLRGTLDTTGLQMPDSFTLQIYTGSRDIWSKTISLSDPALRATGPASFIYNGTLGGANIMAMVNLLGGSIFATVRNIDLTGLANPFYLKVTGDDFSAQATINAIQNIKFMKGYQDTLRISRGTISSNGRFSAQGTLALANPATIETVTLLLDGATYATFPGAGETSALRRQGTSMYLYLRNRTANAGGKVDLALINTDTGMVMIQGTGAPVPSSPADLKIQFANAAHGTFFDATDDDAISP